MTTPDNPLINSACGRDVQYAAAVQLAEKKASVSYLQRNLLISYHHAEDLLERMIEDGHITGYSGRCIERVPARKIIQLRSRIAELEAQQERKPLDTRPVVSDDELTKAFAGSNFGDEQHRQRLHVAVLKKASGYHCGHTITTIMRELRLIDTSGLPTKKGRKLISLAYHALMVGGP